MPLFNPATESMLEALATDLPQGILLMGPSGSGTLTAARHIGRLSGLKNIITIAPDEKGTMTIAVIRNLYTMSRTKSEPKIFIIDDADSMSREAQNAFLKLLEEPNDSTRFILTSHTPATLLPTILSRVQVLALKPISRPQSEQLLDELRVTDPNMRAQLLFVALGLPASLSRYAQDKDLFEKRAISFRDARTFIQGAQDTRLLLAATYSSDRQQTLLWLGDIIRLIERTLAQTVDSRLVKLLDQLLEVSQRASENGNVRLQLTRAILHA